MIGEKRRKLVSGSDNTSESSLTVSSATSPKFRHGKENVPPLSSTDKGAGVFSGAFRQTDGGSEALEQTQTKYRSLCRLDSPLGDGNDGLDSNWTDICASGGLDELDSEILESSGLAELDSEILEYYGAAELDFRISGSSACGGKTRCEPDYRKLGGGSYGVVSRESRSIESRLLSTSYARNGDGQGESISDIDDGDADVVDNDDDDEEDDFESTQFNVLMKLCEGEEEFGCHEPGPTLGCPLCGIDMSEMNEESRQFHANECIDKSVAPKGISSTDMMKQSVPSSHSHPVEPLQCSAKPAAETPVIKWLHSLGLAKYETAFIEQEIDWESLQWLTEKVCFLMPHLLHDYIYDKETETDLTTMGITTLGPRKKIMQSIQELKKRESDSTEQRNGGSDHRPNAAKNIPMNKLITDFFASPLSHKKKNNLTSSGPQEREKAEADSRKRQVAVRKTVNGKRKDVPPWCTVPGTPFRVDAFRYLRRDCSHWFLTHFHIDRISYNINSRLELSVTAALAALDYQGLTKSFSYGKIYCSMITARLVNTKIGIPWDKLEVMPLNQKVNVAGVDITCYDANHCPGAIMLLFEPPNGEPVLHTGDFRFSEDMATTTDLQRRHIHTLILDTTYCNSKYNFPKQEEVMQFVIEAIQAESFNPKTLFLIGSYTIGKERLYLEVARVLKRKIYVPVAKLRLLECLGFPAEDMKWFTSNENESNIHVVPMWTIASFKRLKQLSCQYTGRFSLIVAFSPTGWTLGRGKKSAGRKRQQGTIIRYEVPYSEHCGFEELKEFVKLVSPVKIIPSVNNEGEASSNAMTELLLS
ncbi:hypothetical protein KSS87_006105 [Heliosperma pusillum]|nr:hypothetical protein KSS87_006105 [Heliosperma pusillum]